MFIAIACLFRPLFLRFRNLLRAERQVERCSFVFGEAGGFKCLYVGMRGYGLENKELTTATKIFFQKSKLYLESISFCRLFTASSKGPNQREGLAQSTSVHTLSLLRCEKPPAQWRWLVGSRSQMPWH